MEKEKSLEDFKELLPVSFKDLVLLEKVFVHSSYLNEPRGDNLESYERLEFLGDAVLGVAVSHILYEKFPEMDEGELTGLRARLVNRKTLAAQAKKLNMDQYLLLGKGERATGGSENPTILAGTFEALVAAIYLECGYQEVFDFTEEFFSPLIDASLEEPGHFDFKPKLQELSQRVYKEQPRYRLVKEEGPPHKKVFEIEVIVDGQVLGSGRAGSKKDAEQFAAGEALERLKEQNIT